MTDDIAGQYSDWQDRQDKLNEMPEDEIVCIIEQYLTKLLEEHTGYVFDNPREFRFEANDLVKQLNDHGFQIVIGKEVNK